MDTLIDPIAAPRQRMRATRSALRGTNDMTAYAEMFTTYYNELGEVRAQLLAQAETALESGLPSGVEFARDAMDDVARIDAEMAKIDPR